MVNEQLPSESHDKWIAVGVWLVILAALVYTSGSGANSAVFGGSRLADFLQQLSFAEFGSSGDGLTPLAIANLLLAAALISQIVNAWLRFARLTNELIIAYVKSSASEEKGAMLSSFLVFQAASGYYNENEGDDEIELDPEDADSTLVSDVVRPLAYAWAIMIAAPAIISIIASVSFG